MRTGATPGMERAVAAMFLKGHRKIFKNMKQSKKQNKTNQAVVTNQLLTFP
jgi:hypothetical protein